MCNSYIVYIKYMVLNNVLSYVEELFKKFDINKNEAYFCYESAVRNWFPLKHPYNIVTILNKEINFREKFDNVEIIFIKSNIINMDETTPVDDFFYHKPLALLEEYRKNKLEFLDKCHTKDEVKEMLDIKEEFFKKIKLIK